MTEPTSTGNSGILLGYERCPCCRYCETFVERTVTCPSCGLPCSCEGCVADQQEAAVTEADDFLRTIIREDRLTEAQRAEARRVRGLLAESRLESD